jgi:hypothetical protein
MDAHLSAAGLQPAEKEDIMMRISGSLLLSALLVLGFMVAGCGKKQEAITPGDKPTAVKGVNMREGKWEITSTFEMEGMPAGMMKPQTFTTCLKQNDYVPKDEGQKDCTMKDIRVDGDTVTWEIVCKDSSGKGRVTYAGSTFDGIMETLMKEGGKDMTAKMTMKGKHMGPCDK